MEEIWKDIKGYEGLYQVSNLGRVRSFFNSRTHKLTDTPVLRTPGNLRAGYLNLILCKNGKRKTVMIHRVVAETFIPNPDNKRTVNHIDGNKTNNRVDNLEWNTDSENQLHAHRNGLKPKNSKPVRCIETGQIFPTGSDAARWVGMKNPRFFSYYCMKLHKPLRGYNFEFV